MKKYRITKFFGFIAAIALAMGLFMACDEAPQDEDPVIALDTPTNVQVTVVNRTMTVTWNAVENAQGYEIVTTSTGCGSGNKIINTKANTATNLAGEGAYVKNDKSNGAVVISEEGNSITITLMPKTPAADNPNTPMASAVSAKVKALGDDQYNDSGYSGETELVSASYNTHDIFAAPANVQITVVNRTMTVTWDAVANADGYVIYTTSTGCGSGNKIINTKANTATNLTGAGAYIKSDKSNGAVVIKDSTTIEITLMPARDENGNNVDDTPMATAVSAKVMTLENEVGDTLYLESYYSPVTTLNSSEFTKDD